MSLLQRYIAGLAEGEEAIVRAAAAAADVPLDVLDVMIVGSRDSLESVDTLVGSFVLIGANTEDLAIMEVLHKLQEALRSRTRALEGLKVTASMTRRQAAEAGAAVVLRDAEDIVPRTRELKRLVGVA